MNLNAFWKVFISLPKPVATFFNLTMNEDISVSKSLLLFAAQGHNLTSDKVWLLTSGSLSAPLLSSSYLQPHFEQLLSHLQQPRCNVRAPEHLHFVPNSNISNASRRWKKESSFKKIAGLTASELESRVCRELKATVHSIGKCC